MEPNGDTINKYVGDFVKREVDNYLHIHKEDVADVLEAKIKESERERKSMAGITKLARERAKKANLHNRKLRDCRVHFSDAKDDRKEEASIFITEGDSASEASPRAATSTRRRCSRCVANHSTLLA